MQHSFGTSTYRN